jgi:MarR family transcriptional regulator, transcriptional regulator for hemolysin
LRDIAEQFMISRHIEGSSRLAKSARPKAVKRPTADRFKLGYLIHDVSRIRRTVVDEFMRPAGVTRAQWSVLSMLSRGGPDGMMQVDLARLLDVGKVTVGGLVDRLEASGHVERRSDAIDRRAKRVCITPAGYEIVTQLIELSRELNQNTLEGVSEEDLDTTERTLMRLKSNLKRLLAESRGGAANDDPEEL